MRFCDLRRSQVFLLDLKELSVRVRFSLKPTAGNP